MARQFRLSALALIVVGTAPATSVARQTPTPGALAVLTNTMDSASVQQVADAIGAADPLVRTVAARIAAATAHPPFGDRLAAAFERETDPVAMMEQARALLLMRGAAASPAIEARLPAFTPMAAEVYAGWVAGHYPDRLAALLPQVAARASASRADLAPAVSMALTNLKEQPEPSAALMRAWVAAAAPAVWRSTLAELADKPRPWLDAVVQELPFVERKRFEKMRAAAADPLPEAFRTITEPEAEPMRMMPALWPGFLAGLYEATGCKPGRSPSFGIVGVAYRPDGRVSKIAPQRTSLPPNCAAAVTTLARLTLQEPGFPAAPDTIEWLVLPIGADHLECAGTTPVESATGYRVNRQLGITPPQKTRDVRPQYPLDMQRKRVSGMVLMDAVIGSKGCVTAIRVKRGGELALNYAALRAVAEWRFTPTTVNGTPIPLQMPLTTTFNIQ